MSTRQPAHEKVLRAELADGRSVNMRTTEGALEWMQCHTNPPCCKIVEEIFNSMLQALEQPEQKQRILSDIVLLTHVAMLGALPIALAKKHSSIFQVEDIEHVAALYTQILKHLEAFDERWRQTGILDGLFFFNQLVLDITRWSHIPLFVKAMMPDGFAALAKLMQAPVGDVFPFPWMCSTVLMIINDAHAAVDNLTLKQAKMLGMVDFLDGNFLYRLEPTGLLAQALRALTSPVPVSEQIPIEHLMQFVNVLIRDTKFIWKCCRPGTPLNNTLKALLDGTDGWEAHAHGNTEANPDLPLVKRRLQMLYDKSLLDKISLEDTVLVTCRKCRARTSGSMKCGRCKGAMYCSRYVSDILHCVKWTSIHTPFL
jgi:hypothetical protein